MYVHLKQSGELLTDSKDIPWTPDALYHSARRIQEVQQRAGQLGIRGLMVVPGAGNIVRGDKIKELFGDDPVAQFADAAGRKGTEQNAIMLSGALSRLQVPHLLLGSPGMGFEDPRVGKVPVYTPEGVMDAYDQNKVVVIGGGSGKDGQTTDTAVLDYTLWHGEAFPDTESVALKATKHVAGIFTADPRTDANARQFAVVSAQHMLEQGIGGVDTACLETIASSGGDVELLVYSAECTPLQALGRDQAVGCMGTIITSREVEPTFVGAMPQMV